MKLAFRERSETESTVELIPKSEASREGRRRSADDWSYTLDVNDQALFAGRGFTGHEHLPEFGLINMNGRLYDPLLGRFLSPDNNVQLPDFSQNFNRYSYALNNPLKYTDPDGESLILLAAILGGWIGMGQAMISSDKDGLGLVGDMFKGLFVGAAASAAGAWAGGAAVGALFSQPASTFGGFVVQGAVGGFAGGALGGFVGGAGGAWMNGAGLEQGLNSGLKGALMGSVIGGISGAAFGAMQYGYERNNFMAIEKNSALASSSDGSLTPSTKTLNDFSDEYYPDYKFRNKTNLLYEEGYVEKINPSYGAFTDPKMINGRYNIYFSESSFSSKWNLYLNMGHEYIHVAHMINLGSKINTAYSEYAAYKWNYRVSKSEYFNNQALKHFKPALYNQAILKNVINPNYMQLGNYGIYDFIPKGLY